MEFEKKREVQYLNGERVMHTFSVLSNNQRNRIFGEYLDMKSFMGKTSTEDSNPMEFIKEGKNVLDFTTDVLKASCPTLDTDKIPAFECDKLFEELNEFAFTGGLKN